MQRLHYTGDTILVADEVCAAVMNFARALADRQSSDLVRIPVMDEAGDVSIAEFLIGPASQLYSTPAGDVAEIETDQALVDEIRRRTAMLVPTKARPDEVAEFGGRYDER